MSGLVFPIFIALAAFFAVIYTYSTIKRGGSKVYTLERESILRRATAMLWLSTGLFVTAIALLAWQNSNLTAVPEAAVVEATSAPAPTAPSATTAEAETTPAPAPDNTIPDLLILSPTPTIDPNLPTATPTPIVVRAFITGTGGNGVNFRATPGGELIEILADDTFVTMVDGEAAVEQGGFTWMKVRTFTGQEGWVVTDFLSIEGQ